MKFEHTKVYNIENSLRGMRNPLASWDKSDSEWIDKDFCIGKKDMNLATKLINGGSEHCKFLRQIFVSVDITAPLYWWKEADTYKIGTTANSTSTMHKLASTPITLDCFETDDLCTNLHTLNEAPLADESINNFINFVLKYLEALREKYNETQDKKYWKELIRWLPNGWLQTRTWTANYEVLRNMYHQRKNHKLSEWETFCSWIEKLPYAQDFIIS